MRKRGCRGAEANLPESYRSGPVGKGKEHGVHTGDDPVEVGDLFFKVASEDHGPLGGSPEARLEIPYKLLHIPDIETADND